MADKAWTTAGNKRLAPLTEVRADVRSTSKKDKLSIYRRSFKLHHGRVLKKCSFLRRLKPCVAWRGRCAQTSMTDYIGVYLVVNH